MTLTETWLMYYILSLYFIPGCLAFGLSSFFCQFVSDSVATKKKKNKKQKNNNDHYFWIIWDEDLIFCHVNQIRSSLIEHFEMTPWVCIETWRTHEKKLYDILRMDHPCHTFCGETDDVQTYMWNTVENQNHTALPCNLSSGFSRYTSLRHIPWSRPYIHTMWNVNTAVYHASLCIFCMTRMLDRQWAIAHSNTLQIALRIPLSVFRRYYWICIILAWWKPDWHFLYCCRICITTPWMTEAMKTVWFKSREEHKKQRKKCIFRILDSINLQLNLEKNGIVSYNIILREISERYGIRRNSDLQRRIF